MRLTPWFRVDPAAGAAVPAATIRRSLCEGGLAAIVAGSLIHLALILAYAEDGQGLLMIPVYDWLFALAWGAVFVLLGIPAARAGLVRGVFGLPQCVLFGVAVVFAVMWGLIVAWSDLRSWADSWRLALHFGLVHGATAGLVFWLTLTSRHPAVLPRDVSEPRPLGAVMVGILVFAGVLVFFRS